MLHQVGTSRHFDVTAYLECLYKVEWTLLVWLRASHRRLCVPMGSPNSVATRTSDFLFLSLYRAFFVMLIFFYQQMQFNLTYKILNIKIYIKTLFYNHSYMFRSVRTIIRESILSLAEVTFL